MGKHMQLSTTKFEVDENGIFNLIDDGDKIDENGYKLKINDIWNIPTVFTELVGRVDTLTDEQLAALEAIGINAGKVRSVNGSLIEREALPWADAVQKGIVSYDEIKDVKHDLAGASGTNDGFVTASERSWIDRPITGAALLTEPTPTTKGKLRFTFGSGNFLDVDYPAVVVDPSQIQDMVMNIINDAEFDTLVTTLSSRKITETFMSGISGSGLVITTATGLAGSKSRILSLSFDGNGTSPKPARSDHNHSGVYLAANGNGFTLNNSTSGKISFKKTDGSSHDGLYMTADNNLRLGNDSTVINLRSKSNIQAWIGGKQYEVLTSLNGVKKTGDTMTGGLTASSGKNWFSAGNFGINLVNSDIVGLNALVFNDDCGSSEGIMFPKTGKGGSKSVGDYYVFRIDGAGTPYIGNKKVVTQGGYSSASVPGANGMSSKSVKVYKSPDGSVVINGYFEANGDKANGTVIGTVPSGYRPPFTVYCQATTFNGGFDSSATLTTGAQVRIQSDGKMIASGIKHSTGSLRYLSLNGSWPTA